VTRIRKDSRTRQNVDLRLKIIFRANFFSVPLTLPASGLRIFACWDEDSAIFAIFVGGVGPLRIIGILPMPTIKSYKKVFDVRAQVVFYRIVITYSTDSTRGDRIWVSLFNFFKYFLFLFEDFEQLA